MFRQLVSCNCSLFLHSPLCNSPQPLPSRKEEKSKKSLKGHNNSRYKQTSKGSISRQQPEPEKYPEPSFQQLKGKYNENTICSAKKAARESHIPKNQSGKTKKSIRTLKAKQIDLSNKENEFSDSRIPTESDLSIRPSLNLPHTRQWEPITSKYELNQMCSQSSNIKEGSPLHFDKMQYSAATTYIGQTVFGNSQINKNSLKHPQTNDPLRKHTANIRLSYKPCTFKQEHEFMTPKQHNFCSINLRRPRPKMASELFKFPDLQEIMNEKQETESFYDGQRPAYDSDDECQSSRVLISCRKLMEEKNGILEPSVQAKLFDYGYFGEQSLEEKEQSGWLIGQFENIQKI